MGGFDLGFRVIIALGGCVVWVFMLYILVCHNFGACVWCLLAVWEGLVSDVGFSGLLDVWGVLLLLVWCLHSCD